MNAPFRWLILTLAVVLAPLSATPAARAQDVRVPQRPAQGTYVLDEARLLSPEDAAAVQAAAAKLDTEKRVPIAVVALNSLSDYVRGGVSSLSIERYAGILFNTWGLGYPDYNFGILLLVSKGDRKARIELGAGWKRDYDDATARIMGEQLIPRFKQGAFSAGIRAAVEALDAMARGNAPAQRVLPGGGTAGAPTASAPDVMPAGASSADPAPSTGGLMGWLSRNWMIVVLGGGVLLMVLFNAFRYGGSGGSDGGPPSGGYRSSGWGGTGMGFLGGLLMGRMMGGSSSGGLFGGLGGSSSGGGGFGGFGGGGGGGGGFGGGFSGGGGASGGW